MGQAWNDAVALLSANRALILVVAGVFFFLPNAVGALALAPPNELEAMAASGAEPDFEAMGQVMMNFYAQNWWAFLLLGLVQAIGMLGLLALLTDTSRPTVGQALGFGLKALLPYFGAQILSSVIVAIVAGVLIGVGALINVAVAALLGLVAFILAVYLLVKFSLSSPVIVIEREFNPIRVLQRSWALTKGNSVRLFGFYLLLVLVFIVISAIASMVWAIFSIMGEEIGLFASAIGSSVVSMAFSVVMLAVLAAVHRQLSGHSGKPASETFE